MSGSQDPPPPSVDEDAATVRRSTSNGMDEIEIEDGGTVRMATEEAVTAAPIVDIDGAGESPPVAADPPTTVDVDGAPPDGAADTIVATGEEEEAGADIPPTQPSRARGRAVRRVAQLVVLLGVVVAVAFGVDPFVRHLIHREAEARGVVLETLGDWELAEWSSGGPAEVTLTGVDFALDGVAGVDGTVETVTVGLDGTTPLSLTAKGAELDLTGGATSLALAFSVWTSLHPKLLQIPAETRDMTLRWRPKRSADSWLVAEGASIVPTDHGGRWVSERTLVVGVDVGRVGALWDGTSAEVSLGFGRAELAQAPVLIVVHPLEATADVTLRPSTVASLAGPLAIVLPVAAVTVRGTAKLKLATSGEVTGTTEVTFDGYRVPVPPELRGLVFGDTTVIQSELAARVDRGRISLTNMKVKHGAMNLTGDGLIERTGEVADVTAQLNGSIPCAQLAAAATRARVAGDVGRVLSNLAGRALQGSVGFTLDIEASSAQLADAKIERKLGIGCGLKPGLGLKLPTLDELKERLPADFKDQLPAELRDQLPPELR